MKTIYVALCFSRCQIYKLIDFMAQNIFFKEQNSLIISMSFFFFLACCFSILLCPYEPFWHQGPILRKTIFPWTWGGGDGFRLIQVHYINCILYF